MTFEHPDGSSTQHLNVETEMLALTFGEADWSNITSARVVPTGTAIVRGPS